MRDKPSDSSAQLWVQALLGGFSRRNCFTSWLTSVSPRQRMRHVLNQSHSLAVRLVTIDPRVGMLHDA